MEWDKALAELLLEEPEIRSWLGVDPSRRELPAPLQSEPPRLEGIGRPRVRVAHTLRPAVAA